MFKKLSSNIRLAAVLILLIAGLTGRIQVCAQNSDGRLFPYPVIPEEKQLLSERSNYLVDHFWDRAEFKTAFSSRDKLSAAFGYWINVMPYASADTVHMAIDRLIGRVSKSAPQTLVLAQIAEGWLHSDTSEVYSDELYLPFARAAAANKKVPAADRERFRAQVKIMESSAINAIVPGSLHFTDREGSRQNFSDIIGREATLIVFADPDCYDCTLALTRLSADFNTGQLLDSQRLEILVLYPDEPNEQWNVKAASLPENWTVGTMPEADEYFEIPQTPVYYFLDSQGKVLARPQEVSRILHAFAIMNGSH